jgi:hypothetical protein
LEEEEVKSMEEDEQEVQRNAGVNSMPINQMGWKNKRPNESKQTQCMKSTQPKRQGSSTPINRTVGRRRGPTKESKLEVKRTPGKPDAKKPKGLKKIRRRTSLRKHVGRRGQAKESSQKKAGRSKQAEVSRQSSSERKLQHVKARCHPPCAFIRIRRTLEGMWPT